jgi:hypothetical protein
MEKLGLFYDADESMYLRNVSSMPVYYNTVDVIPCFVSKKLYNCPSFTVNVQHSTQESCRSAGLAEVSTPKLIVIYISFSITVQNLISLVYYIEVF